MEFYWHVNLLNDLQKLKSNPNLADNLSTVDKKLTKFHSLRNFISKDIFKKTVFERVEEILNVFDPTKGTFIESILT